MPGIPACRSAAGKQGGHMVPAASESCRGGGVARGWEPWHRTLAFWGTVAPGNMAEHGQGRCRGCPVTLAPQLPWDAGTTEHRVTAIPVRFAWLRGPLV